MCKNRVSVSGWSPIGCECFRANLNIPCPLPTTLVLSFCRLLISYLLKLRDFDKNYDQWSVMISHWDFGVFMCFRQPHRAVPPSPGSVCGSARRPAVWLAIRSDRRPTCWGSHAPEIPGAFQKPAETWWKKHEKHCKTMEKMGGAVWPPQDCGVNPHLGKIHAQL